MPPFLALNKYLLINPCNKPSKYSYYSHFTDEQAGTERLSNVTTVTQLASGETGILSQLASFAQNIHLLCIKRGVGGGAVGMPR